MTKPEAFNQNIRILKWIFALSQTPLFFFLVIYFHHVSDSYLLAGSALAFGTIAQFAMEIPTGILSDKYLGRKGTYVVGSIFTFLSMVFYALGSINLIFLFIGRFTYGTGKALHSGNTSSLLYDTLRDGKKENEYHNYLAKFSSYKYMYWSISLLAAGFIAEYGDIIYVVYWCILQRLINTILGASLHEPISHKESQDKTRTAITHFSKAVKNFLQNKHLFWLGIIFIARRGILYGLDKFIAVFYKLFFSFNLLGIVSAASLLGQSVVSKHAARITQRIGFLKTFLITEYIALPLQFIACAFPGFYAPFLFLGASQTFPLGNTAESAVLHKNFTNEERATMESVVALCGAIFFAVFTSLIGYLADRWSLPEALLFAVCCRIIIIPLLKHTFKA